MTTPQTPGVRGATSRTPRLTSGEVPVVVDDGVEEVRLPGVFCVPHGPVMKEDVLVGPREVSAILHVDDKEAVLGCPSREGLQLGQHLHGELLQVLEHCGIPGGGKVGPQCHAERRTGFVGPSHRQQCSVDLTGICHCDCRILLYTG